MFVSLLAIIVAANRAEDFKVEAASRGPSSVAQLHKEQILGVGKPVTALRHTEKLHGPLNVRLELVGSPGGVFVLRGILTSREALQDAEFQWSVPEGVTVVNGALTGTVASVTPDQPGTVELTLQATTSGNKQIHLMAGVVRGGGRFSDSAQYNTEGNAVMDAQQTPSDKSIKRKSSLKIFH
jgi:hypothetical protein